MASFNSENNILNQVEREGLFNNLPHIEALAQTHPIIFMDEPQEGMDTENSKQWIDKLTPLFKFRYSATHAVKKNVLYQLTPAESYRLGLVKRLEVLTVSESNDEATMKIEISSVQSSATQVKVKLRFWKLNKTKGRFEFKDSGLLKRDDNLADKSGNESYRDFTISRIYKSMSDRKWHVTFFNGTEIVEGSSSANKEQVWALQLEWLIRRHFENKIRLQAKGIKNLSLIFIDRVANYMSVERPILSRSIVRFIQSLMVVNSLRMHTYKLYKVSISPKPLKGNIQTKKMPVEEIKRFSMRFFITSKNSSLLTVR